VREEGKSITLSWEESLEQRPGKRRQQRQQEGEEDSWMRRYTIKFFEWLG
jgi:hypothetical protein